MIGALILAGGRSSRFGSEKALAEIGGEAIIARVARVLERSASMLAVNAPAGSQAAAFAAARGIACLPDAPGDVDGPLAGVRAGLLWARSNGLDALATAPCDTPFLPQELITRLDLARRGGAAVARTTGGLQPLCAVWPTSALETLESVRDHPPIRRVLAQIGAVEVQFDEAPAFANLNTPEDHAWAQAHSDRGDLP